MLKNPNFRAKRILAVVVLFGGIITWLCVNPLSYDADIIYTSSDQSASANAENTPVTAPLATEILAKLEIKGRAPKTGYERSQFYKDWPTMEDGCNLRQKILRRDLGDSAQLDGCTVIAGEYDEPYSGGHQTYTEKTQISKGLQIDHIVALSNAWQTGAQYKTAEERYAMATDPLNLISVDSSANQQKSDGDAATWLPPNKAFRCQYIARQISVKYKYGLWVTQAEHDAMAKVLETCGNITAIGV